MAGKSTADIHHHHTRLVLKYAFISRLVLISLIVLWRSLLSPYDTSASINPSCLSNTTSIIGLFSGSNSYSKSDSPPVLLPRLASVIEDSIVWDSVYFVRIAQCGYEYEQNYAFLPLIPICISLLSRTGNSLFLIILWINNTSNRISIIFLLAAVDLRYSS